MAIPKSAATTASEATRGTRHQCSTSILAPMNASTAETPSFKYWNLSISAATTKNSDLKPRMANTFEV